MRTDVAAHTTVLAVIVKVLIDVTGTEPVVVPASIWGEWDLIRRQRKLALDALQQVSVIRTKRAPGRATRIWLIDKP